MAEQLNNILWMAEELDFELPPEVRAEAEGRIVSFLQSAANPELRHWVVSPARNMGRLHEQLQAVHDEQPFTMAIDLTHGNLSEQLDALKSTTPVPVLSDLSISRIRKATKPELPTSGHTISHNPGEVRAALAGHDTSHVLVLDDTSFSGSSSLIVEDLIRRALPEREISFTHGFLILNTGELGPNPGSKQRIEAAGSRAVGGMEMKTPRDDGWHFFDLVKQRGLPQHLAAVMGLVKVLQRPDGDRLAQDALSDDEELRLIFPNLLTTEELLARQKLGHFVTKDTLNGDLHVRNPQLLPNIIHEGHLLPPDQWRRSEGETLQDLVELAKLLDREKAHA